MVFQDIDWEANKKYHLKRRRIIWLSILGVIALLIIFLVVYQFTDVMFGLSETIDSAPQPGEWSMFRRDLTHTGNIDPVDSLPQGKLKWTYETGAAIHSSPTIVNGVVYFGSQDSTFYALDAVNGEVLWTFEAGSWIESSPAVVDGVVYFGSNDSNLYALDAATGNHIWTFDTEYAVRSSPAVANGMVYIGSDDYCVYAVDTKTGEEIWHFETDGMVVSAPAVSEGLVAVGSTDGFFYIMSASNGRVRLEFKMYHSVVSSPVIGDGIAYIANTLSTLNAIDISAKNWPFENKFKQLWNIFYLYGIAPKPPAASGYVWSTNLWTKTSSSPSLVDDVLYLGAGNKLMTLNTKTQQLGWVYEAMDEVVSSPAVTDKVVYFGCSDGNLYALDRLTGEKLWEGATGDMITSSPAVSNGMVYIGSHDGKLYAFE
jgi:outer membrane protein assembly factor BamB